MSKRWRPAPEKGKGAVYECENGRIVEVYQTTGGEWAADMRHLYGCTRFALCETRQEAIDKLKEYTDFPRNALR